MKAKNPVVEAALRRIVSKAMEARVQGHGRPFILSHFITHKCMCKCASCLWKHDDWEDLPIDEIKRFYREAKEQGFLATAFTGGEPFLRKDFGEIVRYVKEDIGMPILVFTTGWFLEKRHQEVLPYIDVLMLSVDSANAARHDEIRGLPGLFSKMLKGASLVKDLYPNVTVRFNTCVQKGMAHEVDALIALARDMDMKISFDVITEARNAGDGKSFTSTDEGMPLTELREVSTELLKRKRGGAPILNSDLYFQYYEQGRPGYKCHFPKILMCVDGRGNIEDCLNLERPIANIREMSVKDIMELPRFKQLRTDAEKCCTCSSPTMVDLSQFWENPELLFAAGGISLG